MLEATLCFLIEGDPPAKILLGHKKVGFGRGKWGGIGGKTEAGETPARAAARELGEETGIQVQEADLRPMAHLTFLFPHKPEWSQAVHVFTAMRWEGQAVESREVEPTWLPVGEIPYGQMWADCRHWLPHVLAGCPTRAQFTFAADNEAVAEMQIERWEQEMERTDQERFFTMAEAYDRMCQALVPQYDFLQDQVLNMLAVSPEEETLWVDLGAGSGILLQKVLARWPRARCYWVDYSPDFGQVARERLSRFDGRVEYVLSPLEERWEERIDGPADVILSMSAIHHLEESEKKALYRRCWDRLKPGGWFFNIDEMKTLYDDAYLASMRFWIRHVREAERQIAPDQLAYYHKWKGHFDNWKRRNVDHIDKPKTKGDDLHQDFASQVAWLREAGFINADVLIKYHLWCAIGGQKPPIPSF